MNDDRQAGSGKIGGGGEWTALRERLAQAICEFHQHSRWSRDSESIYHAEADWILALPGAREALAAAPSEPFSHPPQDGQRSYLADSDNLKVGRAPKIAWMDSIAFDHELGDRPTNKIHATEIACRAAHPCIEVCEKTLTGDYPCRAMRVYVFDADAYDATKPNPTPTIGPQEAVAKDVAHAEVVEQASAPVGEKKEPSEVGELQDFNAKFGGDIFVVTGEHQRTAFFSKAAAEEYLAKQDPSVFKIIVYAKPCEHWKASAASDGSTEEDAGSQPEVCQSSSVEVGEGLREARERHALECHDHFAYMANRAALATPDPKPASGEYVKAVALANRVLDRPSGDPDDDLAVLARQFLRSNGLI